MLFFFKRKDVVLDCFTKLPYVYDYAKIDYATKYIPEWWKNTPKTVEGKGSRGTIKNCVAFIEYYKRGIVMPSWFEMELTIHELGRADDHWYTYTRSTSDADIDSSHTPWQFANFAGDDGKNIKFQSPWGFKTKDEIYFSVQQPTWNLRPLLHHVNILPAVVNYKYQHFTHVNMFITNREREQEFTIKPLTPLLMLHPLTERNVVVKTHLVDDKEWNRQFGVYNLMIADNRGYQKKKEVYTTLENQKKCPFHRN
jgi:hypothetical protein